MRNKYLKKIILKLLIICGVYYTLGGFEIQNICFAADTNLNESSSSGSNDPGNSNLIALILTIVFIIVIEMFDFKKLNEKTEILDLNKVIDENISDFTPQIYEFKIGLFNKYIYSNKYFYPKNQDLYWFDWISNYGYLVQHITAIIGGALIYFYFKKDITPNYPSKPKESYESSDNPKSKFLELKSKKSKKSKETETLEPEELVRIDEESEESEPDLEINEEKATIELASEIITNMKTTQDPYHLFNLNNKKDLKKVLNAKSHILKNLNTINNSFKYCVQYGDIRYPTKDFMNYLTQRDLNIQALDLIDDHLSKSSLLKKEKIREKYPFVDWKTAFKEKFNSDYQYFGEDYLQVFPSNLNSDTKIEFRIKPKQTLAIQSDEKKPEVKQPEHSVEDVQNILKKLELDFMDTSLNELSDTLSEIEHSRKLREEMQNRWGKKAESPKAESPK